MATETPTHHRPRSVYVFLVLLALLAAMTAASTIGYIVHQYVTREELRNPPPKEEEPHAQFPSLTILG